MNATVEHQPRERAVVCPWHDPRHPVWTWNWSGKCNQCERRAEKKASR